MLYTIQDTVYYILLGSHTLEDRESRKTEKYILYKTALKEKARVFALLLHWMASECAFVI